MLMELWRRKREAMAGMGDVAIARAHAAGVPAFYMDEGAIIALHPDGTREVVKQPTQDKDAGSDQRAR